MKKLIFGLVLCLSMAIVAQAVPITVENYSFEDPGTIKCRCWDGERIIPGSEPPEYYPDVPDWSSDTEAASSGVETNGYVGDWNGYVMAGTCPDHHVADPPVWQLTNHTVSIGEEVITHSDIKETIRLPGSDARILSRSKVIPALL